MPMFNFGGPQAQLPATAAPGTIMRGPDGQNYQFAQTSGMMSASGAPAGGTGWIQTNTQPRGGFLQQLLAPENAMPIAAALMGQNGNMGNVSNAFSAYGQTAAQTAGKNKTLDFFRKNAPEYAEMVDAGMPLNEAWQTYTQQRYAKTPQGQGFINAGAGNLFNTETGEWVSAPGGGSEGVAGLNPVLLEDEDGNPVVGQLTKDGRLIRSEIPAGLRPVSPYQKSFEAGRGTAEGKATGEAAGALPGATQLAENINQQVNDLKSDPYLPSMLGPVNSRLPNLTTDAARVQDKINQIKGGAFLNGRQALKGGGAITDFESGKAEAAYARLNQAQSEEDFKAALDDFNFYVQQGLQKLQAQAGQQRLGGGPAGAPQSQGGIRFRFNPATGELE